ncbi:MAG: DUF4878 domain-containing protein [Propionibacteriales bacterium]|nr:DUF4878 domain-containing protein [Propionibacteriales bacterium]
MSDPNQPYGAVPPPPPPPGPPSGPPFPAPPGAGGYGSDTSGKGLWITLAVIGVLALAGVIVGLILLLTGDDNDKDAKDGDDTRSSDVSSAETDVSSETVSPTEASPTEASTPTGPTDPSTSGGVIGGNSTADAVANDPKSVVQAFLDSVANGDCATAEDLVTEDYIKEEGNCDPKDIPSDFADSFEYTIGTPKVNDAAGTATVPVEVTFAGDKETSDVELVKVGGLWRVDEF